MDLVSACAGLQRKSGVVPPRFFAAADSFANKPKFFRLRFNRYKEEGTLLWRKPKMQLNNKEEINSAGMRGRRASPLTWYYHIFSFTTQEKNARNRRISRDSSVFSLFLASFDRVISKVEKIILYFSAMK